MIYKTGRPFTGTGRLSRQRWQSVLVGLEGGTLALLALGLCLRGQGQPLRWLLLSLVLPAVQWSCSASTREWLRAWVGRLWDSFRTYPTQGNRTAWLGVFVLVVLPATLLFLSNGRTMGCGDTWPVVPTCSSLVIEGHCDISKFVEARGHNLPYFVMERGEGLYSRYPAGMMQFAFPVVVVSRLAGADLYEPVVRSRIEKWTAAWLAGWSIGLFFLIALHLAEPWAAAVAAALLATGSALFATTAQGLWQQGGVIWWMLVILLAEFRQAARPSWRTIPVQGAACALMLACRLSAVVFILPVGTWLLLRRPRQAVLTGWCAAAVFLPWTLFYLSVYGTPLGPSSGQLEPENWSWRPIQGLLGILISPGRGLLIYQPWLVLLGLLAVPSVRRAVFPPDRGPLPHGWAWCCGTVIVLQLALVSMWGMWWGGYCWGSRLVAETVPLLALLCLQPINALGKSASGKWLLAGLAVMAFLLQIPFVYGNAEWWNPLWDVDNHPEHLWSWSRPPWLYPFQH